MSEKSKPRVDVEAFASSGLQLFLSTALIPLILIYISNLLFIMFTRLAIL